MKMKFEYFDQEYFDEIGYYDDKEMINEFKGKLTPEMLQILKEKLRDNSLLIGKDLIGYYVTFLDDVFMITQRENLNFESAIDYMIKDDYDKLKEIIQYQMVHTILN